MLAPPECRRVSRATWMLTRAPRMPKDSGRSVCTGAKDGLSRMPSGRKRPYNAEPEPGQCGKSVTATGPRAVQIGGTETPCVGRLKRAASENHLDGGL